MNEGVLIFLTGQDEIDSTCKMIRQIAASGTEGLEPILVQPLYANMTTSKQMLVFQQTPESKINTYIRKMKVKRMKFRYSKSDCFD